MQTYPIIVARGSKITRPGSEESSASIIACSASACQFCAGFLPLQRQTLQTRGRQYAPQTESPLRRKPTMLDIFRLPGTRQLDLRFAGLWLFIALVSVHDGYLAVLHRSVLKDFELNPVGQRLLQLEGGVWVFVLAKGAGTVVACALILMLLWINPRMARCAVLTLAVFQLCLLLYLSVDWWGLGLRWQLALSAAGWHW
jgi:hypothetical protein